MTLVAGVDSSTQSCKVVIRDAATGALVRSGRASHPDGTEVDPAAWWDALQSAIAAAGGLDDVAAVSVGGQQHGMVVLDAEGRVIRPALLWNDTRSAQAAARPDRRGRRRGVRRAHRASCRSRRSRRRSCAGCATPSRRTPQRVAAVALPHDWLTWRLAATVRSTRVAARARARRARRPTAPTRAAPATGAPTGATTASCWSRARATTRSCPACSARRECRGADARPASLVGPGAGDNAAAALGLDAAAGRRRRLDRHVRHGVRRHRGARRRRLGHGRGLRRRDGQLPPPDRDAQRGARARRHRRACSASTTTSSAGSRSRRSPGHPVLVLVPYFEGERTPNLPDATASFSGLTLANTTRDRPIARAAVEGMLCGLADGLDAVRGQGVAAERVLLIGGAAQNPAVRAIAAQVFDVPVVVPEPGEYVADGAARQAAWVLTGSARAWPRRDRRGTRGRHAPGHPAAVRGRGEASGRLSAGRQTRVVNARRPPHASAASTASAASVFRPT